MFPNAKAPKAAGATLPRIKPVILALPLTIVYNADQAKLKPAAFTGSPSIIIQVPKRLAAPKVKHEALVGLIVGTAVFKFPDLTGTCRGDNPFKIKPAPNIPEGIGEVPKSLKVSYTCLLIEAIVEDFL